MFSDEEPHCISLEAYSMTHTTWDIDFDSQPATYRVDHVDAITSTADMMDGLFAHLATLGCPDYRDIVESGTRLVLAVFNLQELADVRASILLTGAIAALPKSG